MAEYDLTSKLGQYLDRHLVYPLLEFLTDRNIFNEQDILQAKYDLLGKTNMIDFQLDIFSKLNPGTKIPEDLLEKRTQILNRFQELEKLVQPILDAVMEIETDESSEIDRNETPKLFLENLREKINIDRPTIDNLYKFARFAYDCANYQKAALCLELFQLLAPPNDSRMMSCQWGKFASSILMQRWDTAYENFKATKRMIDMTRSSSNLSSSLQERTWFLHWSLFVFFNHSNGLELLIKLFFDSGNSNSLSSNSYLNTLQTTSPHLLRYLTTTIIISPKKAKQQHLKDLIKLIEQESYAFRDPITEFIRCLYSDLDFDGAREKLIESGNALKNDFFLVSCSENFIENGRLMIAEVIFRTYRRCKIRTIADKLMMNFDETESWIRKHIENGNLNVKLDDVEETVVLILEEVSPYALLWERTKNLYIQTENLFHSIEKKK